MNRREADRLIDRWQANGRISRHQMEELEEFVDSQQGGADDLRPLLVLLARDAEEPDFVEKKPAIPMSDHNPADFTERVMQQVKWMRKPAKRRISAGRVAASVGLAAALTVAVGVWHLVRENTPAMPVAENQVSESLVVRFELVAPEASTVSLVGDFNDWDAKSHTLKRLEDGTWVIDMKLRRGEFYSYNFLVDKEMWVPDPQADYQISDPFGGRKSVMSL